MLTLTSLDQLALCASYCAYFVQGTSFVPPKPGESGFEFLAAAGFIATPVAFTSGDENINAAIIAETESTTVLAFRGTLPPGFNCPSFLDWLQDLHAVPKAFPNMPGKVHSGIYEGFVSLWKNILPTLTKYLSRPNPKPLLITGHSKGGPMASYATWDVNRLFSSVHKSTVTFASPHPGDKAFAEAFQGANLYQKRYEGYLDVVPFLPPTAYLCAYIAPFIQDLIKALPSGELKDALKVILEMVELGEEWNYEAVGTLRYIQDNNTIIPDYPGLYLERANSFLTEISNSPTEAPGVIAHAHTIGCGGHYQKGVYPGICGS